MKSLMKIFWGYAGIVMLYPVGLLMASALIFWCLSRYMRIKNWHRLPIFRRKIIVISNHPSMLDPFIVYSLFFPSYLISPFRHAPCMVGDMDNIAKSPRFSWWVWPILEPADRSSKKGGAQSISAIEKRLDEGGIIITFPGNGRDLPLPEMKFLPSEKYKIRVFNTSIGRWVVETGASVLPVFLDGFDKVLPNLPNRKKLYHTDIRLANKVTVKVGNLISFTEEELRKPGSKKEVTEKLEQALLQLADEE